ncbi:MAG: extracellular solute-binding protein [Ruminococcus sp.]|nr:extracellular solute-binding protein [Ruminococcus sp.]
MFKKIFSVLTAAALCLTVSSCGKSGEEQVSEVTAATTANGKKIIKICSLFSAEDDLQNRIVSFNKNSAEYTAELTEYADVNYFDAITRLNLDITTANAPDILVITSPKSYTYSYMDKGLFADLYEFIDSDPDLKRGDFLDSVLKAGEKNGKLFSFAPKFYVDTVVGKTSLVGDKQGRTVEEFIELVDKYPDKQIMEGNGTKGGALIMLALYDYGRYVDQGTGECSFDSEDFIRLLEFCNRFPYEVDGYDQDNLRDGTSLFSSFYSVSNFYDIHSLEYYAFGEPVTFMGFPGVAGNGSVIQKETEYAIISNSANKGGAWEFLKYFLSEEYQDGIALKGESFPVRLSSLELAAEEAKKGTYDSITGEYIEPVGGVNTDEDNQRVYDLLGSATGAVDVDSRIYEIISVEADAYFAGQKSAKEAAEIIQNRISNYLAENH